MSGSDDRVRPLILGDLAGARSGDKGSSANIGVLARSAEVYAFLRDWLTAERVAAYFKPLGCGKVHRYELANIDALNFVLEGVLAGGGSRSLRTDAQGKTLGQALLLMPVTDAVPADLISSIKRSPA